MKKFWKDFFTNGFYPLWEKSYNYLVPRIRIGVISVMVGLVYWGASRLHRPPKPPSAPTSTFEMRPHPSQTLEASGAEVVPKTSHEPSLQIAYLIAPDESELSDIDLAAADLAPSTNATATQREGPSTSETDPHSDISDLIARIHSSENDLLPIFLDLREKAELAAKIREKIRNRTRRLQQFEELAQGRDAQEEYEKESGVIDSQNRIELRKQMDACADSLREDLHSLELELAVIKQELLVATKKWDLLMEKAREIYCY